MRGIKQWQIKPGTILLKWVADSQQLQETQCIYLGGAEQIFIYQPQKYKHYQNLKNEEKKGIRK